TLLVPCDFTEVAINALQHAVILAKKINAKIVVFNVVKKEKEIVDAIEQLKSFVSKASLPGDVEIEFAAKDGTIYDAIKEKADEISATFVVMGTHGITGMQKLIGSKALKVIANSIIPFIVVQDKPSGDVYFSKIVVPVDFTVENKEKLKWAHYISVYFNSTMVLYVVNITDEVYLKKVKANLLFAKKYFEEREINYEIHIAPSDKKFEEAIIEFSNTIKADGLLIMTTKDPRFTDFIFGAEEQEIIANNAKIPVICINPRTDTKKFQSFH
ncbi:MAG: universal stress protein, partial [Bacteroidales bacterium]|nr:universal stress protein [Bacteroidales bacterium]